MNIAVLNDYEKSKMTDSSEKEDGDTKPCRRVDDIHDFSDADPELNIDRRKNDSDRRSTEDSSYKGPARRLTIDRRMTSLDRRNSDEEQE